MSEFPGAGAGPDRLGEIEAKVDRSERLTFDDGVFLLAGSLQPGKGGTVIAHNTTLELLQARVDRDPFVAEDVVSAEILEITPSRTDEKLAFLAA